MDSSSARLYLCTCVKLETLTNSSSTRLYLGTCASMNSSSARLHLGNASLTINRTVVCQGLLCDCKLFLVNRAYWGFKFRSQEAGFERRRPTQIIHFNKHVCDAHNESEPHMNRLRIGCGKSPDYSQQTILRRTQRIGAAPEPLKDRIRQEPI